LASNRIAHRFLFEDDPMFNPAVEGDSKVRGVAEEEDFRREEEEERREEELAGDGEGARGSGRGNARGGDVEAERGGSASRCLPIISATFRDGLGDAAPCCSKEEVGGEEEEEEEVCILE
jgi:hypothetical protein